MSSAQTTWSFEMDKRTLHLMWAQELNNRAAMCFERGLHKQATKLLHDGLKLLIAINHQHYNEKTSDNAKSTPNNLLCCSFCGDGATLDQCITYSQQASCQMESRVCSDKDCSVHKTVSNDTPAGETKNHRNSNPKKKRRLSSSKDVANGYAVQSDTDQPSTKNGYVFQQPIRIPLEGFCQCQRGYTCLVVVIVFNLAIIHHHSIIDDVSLNAYKVENISFLYKLCLDLIGQTEAMVSALHTRRSTMASSTRCEMLIHNNVSQLYLMDGNNTLMQEKSQQDLLSTFMILIERGTRQNDDYIDIRRGVNTQQEHGRAVSNLVHGILENLGTLILKNQCADAA